MIDNQSTHLDGLFFVVYKSAMMKIDEVVKLAGMSKTALAHRLGIPRQYVHQWKYIPPARVLAVQAATGIHRSKIRPDIYPPRKRNGRS